MTERLLAAIHGYEVLKASFPLHSLIFMSYDIVIPDEVLSAAEQITLKDLLNSPSCQCFTVSALGNSVQSAHKFHEVTTEMDDILQSRLLRVYNAIPYKTRRDCFHEVGMLIRERKEERRSQLSTMS